MIDFNLNETAIEVSQKSAIDKINEYEKRVYEICHQALAIKVENDEARSAAANMSAALKTLKREIKERANEVCEPAKSFINQVNALLNRFYEKIDQAVAHLSSEELKYIEIIELQRREAEKKMKEAMEAAQRELEEKAKEMGVEPIVLPEPVVPKEKKTLKTEQGVTSYYVTKWLVEVFDASRVPAEYCSPDMKKLQAAVDAGIRNIPGCKIYEKKELRHRR